MNAKDESFLTISDIFFALRKHWKLAMFSCLLLTVFAGLFVYVVLRPTFESDGQLYVRLGKNTLTADPTTASNQPVSSLENRLQEVISVRELVGSRAVSERVAKRIGVEKILDLRSDLEKFIASTMKQVKIFESKKVFEGMTKEQIDEHKELESAIKYVQKAIDVESPKESYLVRIAAKAHDPLVARDIVQFTMEEYQSVHLAAHKPSSSLNFFENQVETQRKLVIELENRKRDELNRRNILSVDAERNMIHGRVTTTTTRLSEVTSMLEGQRARVAELKSQIEGLSETLEIEQTAGIADAATDLIKSSVFALEVEHQKAAAVYNSSHPALISKKNALAEARAVEGRQPQEREQRRQAINPNRMALELEYAKGIGELENYQSQLAFLESDLSELKLREKQLNEDEIFFNDLQRSIQIAVSEFNAFSTKREQSKVTEAIDQQQFSDVNIAQNATLNVTKTGLSRLLMLAVCFLGATFFGGGCAVAREIIGTASKAHSQKSLQPMPELDDLMPAPVLPKPIVAPAPSVTINSPTPVAPAPALARTIPTPAVAQSSPAVSQPQGTYRVYSGRFRVQAPGDYITDDIKLDPIPGT